MLSPPTQVSFEKRVSGEGEEGEEGEEVVKVVKKTLFQRSNAYPQKKVLTFNRYSKDFPFSVYYSHLGFLSDDEKTYVSLPTVWLCRFGSCASTFLLLHLNSPPCDITVFLEFRWSPVM